MVTSQDESDPLVSSVTAILRNYDSGDFFNYWKLVQETLVVSSFKEVYIYLREGEGDSDSGRTDYLNVVFLTDGLLIDLEGGLDGEDRPDSSTDFGELKILPLSSISAVQFHLGPIKALERSTNSNLIMFADIIGLDRMGRYWLADTDCQYRSLLAFGTALIRAVESSAANRTAER